MSEFTKGLVGGAVGVTLCYPVGTLKTRLQTTTNYNPLRDLRRNGLRSLYVGYTSPLIGMMLEKSVLFYGYSKIKNMWITKPPTFFDRRIIFSPLKGGFLAGILTTFIVTPFERVMIVSQTQKVNALAGLSRVLRSGGLYRGFTTTFFREVPGYAIYFNTYEYLNGYNPALVGAACGVSAWSVIYPSDPVKTVMQEKNIGIREAARLLYRQRGVRGFYTGFLYANLRAAILHAGVISGYHLAHSIL